MLEPILAILKSETGALVLMVIAGFLGALGQVSFKKGAKAFNFSIQGILKNKNFLWGVILYLAATALFLGVLKFTRLSYAYPLASITYIWVTILANKMLGEKIGQWKLIGILLVIIGVVFINL